MELLEAWCLVGQALAGEYQVSQELESLVLGSLVLESLVLASLVLDSQVLGSQELSHQLQLLKQLPKLPNLGPEPEWELEAFPLSGLVLGAFLATGSDLESEVFLELPSPLQPKPLLQLRQPLQPRPPPSMVLEEQEPWEG